ncbi:hypothetical protein CGRA01v4_04695 [Colletotrichum graminicola]|nr:hypothetical protein CGRA01v4_04695 [Colletotrichum graminicola]
MEMRWSLLMLGPPCVLYINFLSPQCAGKQGNRSPSPTPFSSTSTSDLPLWGGGIQLEFRQPLSHAHYVFFKWSQGRPHEGFIQIVHGHDNSDGCLVHGRCVSAKRHVVSAVKPVLWDELPNHAQGRYQRCGKHDR